MSDCHEYSLVRKCGVVLLSENIAAVLLIFGFLSNCEMLTYILIEGQYDVGLWLKINWFVNC